MVEAGADEIPEDSCSRRSSSRTRRSSKLCEAQEELARAGRQGEVARPDR